MTHHEFLRAAATDHIREMIGAAERDRDARAARNGEPKPERPTGGAGPVHAPNHRYAESAA